MLYIVHAEMIDEMFPEGYGSDDDLELAMVESGAKSCIVRTMWYAEPADSNGRHRAARYKVFCSGKEFEADGSSFRLASLVSQTCIKCLGKYFEPYKDS